MTFNLTSKERGFTLIELVTVIVLLGILAGSSAPLFSQGLTASRLTRESLDTLAKIRYAVERIAREVRQVNHNGTNFDLTTMNATQIVFNKNDASSTQVTIQETSGTVAMTYSAPSTTSTLTDEVTALSIRYLDGSNVLTASSTNVRFVEVTLTLVNSVTSGSVSQRTRIALRDG